MRLKLDDDKYILVEENSILTIVAEGTKEDSKTAIHLEQGAITNEIQNKLNPNSSYEVTTPNSVMAVREPYFAWKSCRMRQKSCTPKFLLSRERSGRS